MKKKENNIKNQKIQNNYKSGGYYGSISLLDF